MSRVFVIDWLDHCELGSSQAWTNAAGIEAKAPLIRSVGFIVKESSDSVVISHTLHEGECSSPFLILKSAIIRQEPLKLPPLRRRPKG